MLDGLKRLFSGAPAAAPEGWEGIAPWAASRHYAFRDVPNEGFVIDGRLEATPWRLEWGPSQRPYIGGHELRLRAEMGLPSDLQLVVMNRELQETMEQAVFNQYVEGVQTRIDNQTPPEMRWLVMFPRLPAGEMGALHERFIALSNNKGWLVRWLEGPAGAIAGGFARGVCGADGADDRSRPPDAAHGAGRARAAGLAGLAAPVRDCDARSSPRQRQRPASRARPAPGTATGRAVPCPGTSATSSAARRACLACALVSPPCFSACASGVGGAHARGASLPSSILAMALRCTSSGPSAKRSVRARV